MAPVLHTGVHWHGTRVGVRPHPSPASSVSCGVLAASGVGFRGLWTCSVSQAGVAVLEVMLWDGSLLPRGRVGFSIQVREGLARRALGSPQGGGRAKELKAALQPREEEGRTLPSICCTGVWGEQRPPSRKPGGQWLWGQLVRRAWAPHSYK